MNAELVIRYSRYSRMMNWNFSYESSSVNHEGLSVSVAMHGFVQNTEVVNQKRFCMQSLLQAHSF
jgi:hypothetical protein